MKSRSIHALVAVFLAGLFGLAGTAAAGESPFQLAIASCTAVPSPCPCESSANSDRIRVVLTGARARTTTGVGDSRTTQVAVTTTPGTAAATATRTVGLVLPASGYVRGTLSGRVVEDPKRFADIPSLRVVELQVPMTGTDAPGTPLLQTLRIETGGGQTQAADQPVRLQVPETGQPLMLTIRSAAPGLPGSQAQIRWDVPTTQGTVPAQPRTAVGAPRPQDFQTPAIAIDGGVQMIRGSFDGDLLTTSVAMAGKPATMLAETQEAVYFTLPEGLTAGPQQLELHEGSIGVQFPVSLLTLTMSADQVELLRGQSTRFQATVAGPEQLPASAWQQSAFPDALIARDRLARIAPKFRAPGTSNPGVIMLRLENMTPDTVSMSPSDQQVLVLTLQRKDFAGGPYTVRGTVRSQRTGSFLINGLTVAFVAPVSGTAIAAR